LTLGEAPAAPALPEPALPFGTHDQMPELESHWKPLTQPLKVQSPATH